MLPTGAAPDAPHAPRGDILDFRHWLSDLADVACLAADEYPNIPIHLVGHCFGANLALGGVLSGELVADSIVMLTPGLFVLPTYSAWTKLQIAMAGLLAPAKAFRVPQDDELFSRDPEVVAWIARDTLGARRVTARALMQINRMMGEIRAAVGVSHRPDAGPRSGARPSLRQPPQSEPAHRNAAKPLRVADV